MDSQCVRRDSRERPALAIALLLFAPPIIEATNHNGPRDHDAAYERELLLDDLVESLREVLGDVWLGHYFFAKSQ